MPTVKYGRLIEEDTWDPDAVYKKAIMFDVDDIGKLRIRGSESLRHFLAKSILMYYLLRLKHRVVCEVEIAGCAVIDVFDIDTNVMYELETERSIANIMRNKEKYHQAGVDLVIIQLPRHTTDIGEMADYVKRFIRPD